MLVQFRSIFFLMIMCFSGVLLAQVPTDVVTESTEDDIFLDGVVPTDLVTTRRVIPYKPVREADVPWQRKIWRVIDIREKANLAFGYPDRPFITVLIEGLQSGELVAFAEDDFKTQMSEQEIQDKVFKLDTVRVTDLETYETTFKVVENELNPADIIKFRVKEVWYFDEGGSILKSRILGIGPIKEEYDDNGNFKYSRPMFWVYYPQAREYLGRQTFFIEGNDAAPNTWETTFEGRQFASYITKANNVFGYRVQDYPSLKEDPIEQLYESERIKEALFNWEHDLWSY